MFSGKLRETVVCKPDFPIACTKKGKIRGIKVGSTYIFRGIRYAAARRFHKAREMPPWDGVRDALCYGYVPPLLRHEIAADERFVPHFYMHEHEDCQYMNIWTQSLDRAAKLPVMVWFHGGGWNNGSSIEQLAYDGGNISKFGELVFVTFNNRQNCYGALDLSSFGNEYKDSVMAGMSDVITAMKWIQEHIGAFGGDPANVTIVGQAGGAKRAMALMQTPEADGLYHKAAVGSCAGEHMEVPKGWTRKSIAQRMGQLTVSQLGLDRNTVREIETVSCWRLADAVNASEKILKQEVSERFRWEPIPDNLYFFENPFQVGFRRETQSVPLMTGSSFGEMESNARVPMGDRNKNTWTKAYVQMQMKAQYGEKAEAVANAFQAAYPGRSMADALFIDRKLRGTLAELSRERAKTGASVWNWLFDLESPVDGGTVAWHCSETPYIMGNAIYTEASFISGITENLQGKMMCAWTAFAKKGNPNCPKLPEWKTVSEDEIPTMVFGKNVESRTNHDRELLRILIG